MSTPRKERSRLLRPPVRKNPITKYRAVSEYEVHGRPKASGSASCDAQSIRVMLQLKGLDWKVNEVEDSVHIHAKSYKIRDRNQLQKVLISLTLPGLWVWEASYEGFKHKVRRKWLIEDNWPQKENRVSSSAPYMCCIYALEMFL